MFPASRIGWARIAFALVTSGMLAQGSLASAAAPDSMNEGTPAFVVKNEIMKMQKTLRIEGHYRGPVDGVFGLRTRAGLRAFQKAENLPISGQVDNRTAEKLGVRPELTWGDSQSTEREVGRAGDAAGEIRSDKPSAGIKWVKGLRRTSKTPRQAVTTVASPESSRHREKELQAENDKHPQ